MILGDFRLLEKHLNNSKTDNEESEVLSVMQTIGTNGEMILIKTRKIVRSIVRKS